MIIIHRNQYTQGFRKQTFLSLPSATLSEVLDGNVIPNSIKNSISCSVSWLYSSFSADSQTHCTFLFKNFLKLVHLQ